MSEEGQTATTTATGPGERSTDDDGHAGAETAPAGQTSVETEPPPRETSPLEYLNGPVGVEQLRLYVTLYAAVGVGAGVVGAVVAALVGGALPTFEDVQGPTLEIFRRVASTAVGVAVVGGLNLLSLPMAAVFGLRMERELIETELRGVYVIAAAANGLGAFVMGAVGGVLVLGGSGLQTALTAAAVAAVVAAALAAGTVRLTTSEFVRGPPDPAVTPSEGDTTPASPTAPGTDDGVGTPEESSESQSGADPGRESTASEDGAAEESSD